MRAASELLPHQEHVTGGMRRDHPFPFSSCPAAGLSVRRLSPPRAEGATSSPKAPVPPWQDARLVGAHAHPGRRFRGDCVAPKEKVSSWQRNPRKTREVRLRLSSLVWEFGKWNNCFYGIFTSVSTVLRSGGL